MNVLLFLFQGETFCLELLCGTCIVSANEVCRWMCGHGSCGAGLSGRGIPSREALVDYWMEWESRELRVSQITLVGTGGGERKG